MIKLHVGCGTRKLKGFVNIDIEENPDIVRDVREGLPFPDKSVDFVFAEHFIEHLTRDEVIMFLKEVYRILKPGGVCRIATPDLTKNVERYIQNSWSQAEWITRFHYQWIPNRCVMLNLSLREWGHQHIYDLEDLVMVGHLAGFLLWEQKPVSESMYKELEGLEHRSGSLVVEFTKENGQHAHLLPLVSICIPAYNPKFFLKALQSALSQTYLNFEVIVCDDSPGEEIEKFVHSLGDSRVQFFKNPKNLGSCDNYFLVLSKARGKYVKFLNDDDLLHPMCLKNMVAYFEAYDKRITLVTSKRNRIDENENLLPDDGATRPLSDRDVYITGIDCGNLLLTQLVNFIGEPSTVMFRREDAHNFKTFFYKLYGEEKEQRGLIDVALWIWLLAKGNIIYIAQPLSSFRQHAQQTQRNPEMFFFSLKSWYHALTKSRSLGYLQSPELYFLALTNLRNALRGWLSQVNFLEEERANLIETIKKVEDEMKEYQDVQPSFQSIRLFPIIRESEAIKRIQINPEKQYQTIQELIKKGFIEESIELLHAFIACYPDTTEALNDLGVLHFLQGHTELAIMILEECLNRDAHNILATENLRDIYERIGERDKAESYTKRLKILQNPKVSIIIPVFNKVELTEKCLQALFTHTPSDIPWEVIVVDNASSDRTPEFLKEATQKYPRLRYLRNTVNLGFAKACNQGAEVSSGEYLLFLNNDTEVQENWLQPMVKLLDNDFRVGAVGGKLLFPDGSIQHAGVIILDHRKSSDPLYATHVYQKQSASLEVTNERRYYQAVTAACLLIRRKAFEEVEGFDEEYWNGYEDVDLCFKLQSKGWLIVYEPQSVVIHHEAQSGPERFRKVRENIERLHKKWLGKITPDYILFPDNSLQAISPPAIKKYEPPLTSIILLTRNNLEYTQKCLESIRRYTPEPHEIIVVDNGSTDGTVEFLGQEKGVTLVQNGENLGFPLGNNRGIREAKGNYLLFLNNDTIVTEGWLRRLIACAESDPRVGIVGPCSNYVAGLQIVPQVPYGEDMDKMQEFARAWSLERAGKWENVGRVIGFCMLVKREVIEAIGGFDLYFGLGNFEDDDFCIRAQLAGFRIKVAHDVFIHHFGSKTFQREKIDYRALMLENWEKFKKKWELPQNLSPTEGYPLGTLLKRSFSPAEHFVPLQPSPYPLDGARKVRYLAPFSEEVLLWYLRSFSPEEEVTLVVYEEGEPSAVLQKMTEFLAAQGIDPEKTPDILLVNESLSEGEHGALIQAVDTILLTENTPSSWKRWARYLGKRVENTKQS